MCGVATGWTIGGLGAYATEGLQKHACFFSREIVLRTAGTLVGKLAFEIVEEDRAAGCGAKEGKTA
jgi:hypothetical protein